MAGETKHNEDLNLKKCYNCGKIGHVQRRCRKSGDKPPRKTYNIDRFYIKGDVDKNLAENPHQLSLYIVGLPNQLTINLVELGKRLMSQINATIKTGQYKLTRPWLEHQNRRSGDMLIKFSDQDTKTKFENALMKNCGILPRFWPAKPLQFQWEKQKFDIKFWMPLTPELDKVYTKALLLEKLDKSFEIIVKRTGHTYIDIFYQRKNWQIKSFEDIEKVKKILNNLERKAKGRRVPNLN